MIPNNAVGLIEIRFDQDFIKQCDVGYDEPLESPPSQNW
jgi:hypothetical protein